MCGWWVWNCLDGVLWDVLSPSIDCEVRFRLSRSACSEDRDVDVFFLFCFKLDAVADGWGPLVGGTGMLNSCGGGREITELAPIVGIYPSGGSLNERWETVGLRF